MVKESWWRLEMKVQSNGCSSYNCNSSIATVGVLTQGSTGPSQT